MVEFGMQVHTVEICRKKDGSICGLGVAGCSTFNGRITTEVVSYVFTRAKY